MRPGRHELGDGVGEGLVGVHVEHRDGVAALFHAALGKDDGDEVHAGRLEEGQGGGGCEKAYIGGRDVADNVQTVVNHGDGREAFGAHQNQGFCEGSVGAAGCQYSPSYEEVRGKGRT